MKRRLTLTELYTKLDDAFRTRRAECSTGDVCAKCVMPMPIVPPGGRGECGSNWTVPKMPDCMLACQVFASSVVPPLQVAYDLDARPERMQ